MRLFRHRPSPALIVAIVALVAGLAGNAVAASSSDNKQDKKIANKEATKVVKKLAPGLSVKFATTAGTAVSATNADLASHATNASSADTIKNLKRFSISVPDTTATGQDFFVLGPFTLKVICRINNAGVDSVEVKVRGSAHSAMDASTEQADMVAGTDYTWVSQQSNAATGDLSIEASSSGTQSEGLYAADGSAIATGQTDVGINLGGHVGQCQVWGFLQTM
jgi:hypothetical protein